jgi:hypothetical protein
MGESHRNLLLSQMSPCAIFIKNSRRKMRRRVFMLRSRDAKRRFMGAGISLFFVDDVPTHRAWRFILASECGWATFGILGVKLSTFFIHRTEIK